MSDQNEWNNLKLDLARRFAKYSRKNFLWKAYYYFFTLQYRTLLLYRLKEIFNRVFLLNSFLSFCYRMTAVRSGIEILCPIGGGVIFPHFGPIKLNAERIGDNLYVFHGVTIGNDYVSGKPVLGNNIFIGANSVIMGKVKIGNNVVIGAGSMVNINVPDNHLVAGNPAKIIKEISPDYIRKMIGY